MMGRCCILLVLMILALHFGFSAASASATPPAKIIGGLVSNMVSALIKWLWSLKSSTPKPRPASTGRSLMKFEGGYNVETLFDGGSLDIDTHAVEASPNGDLLLLDSANSNIFKISAPVSSYSRPKLVAGSQEGYSGHVDGKPREARMNHPKSLAVDDRGNIYVADTMNMAIRKISSSGIITTIAGGKRGRSGSHIDGPSEDAKFSSDFDIVYVRTSCSLLILDRGKQAIREIRLHEDDCIEQPNDDNNLHLGIAVFVAAGFFGYMLALLHCRVKAMFSSKNEPRNVMGNNAHPMSYQRPHNLARPPLIRPEDEKQEEGFFFSLGRLFLNTTSSLFEIIGGLFFSSKKKSVHYKSHQQYQQQQQQPFPHPNAWPLQESYVIPDEDEPPALESRAATPRKRYHVMAKDGERNRHQLGQPRDSYGVEWEDNCYQPQPQPQPRPQPQRQQQLQQQRQQHPQHYSSTGSIQAPFNEKSREKNEIVFGAVQEQDGRREAMVIKAVDYVEPAYNHQNIRPRINYMGYSHRY